MNKNEINKINKVIYSNIKYLAKQNNIKIVDIENNILKRRSGYLSRKLNIQDAAGITHIELIELSHIFNITLDELINNDIYKKVRIKELEQELKELKEE